MLIKKKRMIRKGESMVCPAELAAEKEEAKKIPISNLANIEPEKLKNALTNAYNTAVTRTIEDLQNEAKKLQENIQKKVDFGDMKKAQQLIDKSPPYFKIDVKDHTVKVSVTPEAIKYVKEQFKPKEPVDKLVNVIISSVTSEITKADEHRGTGWRLLAEELKKGGGWEGIAELFVKNFNEIVGITPPPGIKPENVPKTKKIKFENATIPADKLPLYASYDAKKGEIYIAWAPWIEESTKKVELSAKLSGLVPTKLKA